MRQSLIKIALSLLWFLKFCFHGNGILTMHIPNNVWYVLFSNCGSGSVGIAFLLSYLVISFLIVINMYIAVILENYSQATEEVQEGLTDDDYDMYYEIWAQFDPDGTQYIKYQQLSDFLHVLEPPMQIHKPNKFKIIAMDIPICQNDTLFCVVRQFISYCCLLFKLCVINYDKLL
jgi:hypothetical protein